MARSSRSPQEYKEEFDHLDAQKRVFSSEFQEIVDYVLPDRTNTSRWESPGQRRGISRYDSTAVKACELLAGNLATTLTPMQLQWFQIVPNAIELRENTDNKAWAQQCRDLMLNAMSTSNFYLTMDEVYLDLCGFGTAAPYAETLNNRLHLTCWPVREYVFTIGIDGRARSVFRKFNMTPIMLRDRFRDHPGKIELGASVDLALADNATADLRNKNVEILHVVEPRQDYKAGRAGAKNMPYISCYINCQDKVKIAEGGYMEMPVSIPRWRVTADDKGWGRSPGFNAMPDVRSLNAMKKMMHRAAAKDLDPPLMIDDRGVIGSVRTRPNGITYLRPNARMEYLTSGTRLDTGAFDLEDTRKAVREAFFADQLSMPPPQAKPMTATEWSSRWELMERLLGPTLGRIQTELLNPIIERIFGMMMRGGQLPPPPPELMEAELNIEYQGPGIKTQQLPQAAAIERTYQTAAGLAQLSQDPSIMMRLDGHAAVKRIAHLYGYPADAMRGDEQIAEMMQQQAQQQQEMQQREDAALAADMASKVQGGAA